MIRTWKHIFGTQLLFLPQFVQYNVWLFECWLNVWGFLPRIAGKIGRRYEISWFLGFFYKWFLNNMLETDSEVRLYRVLSMRWMSIICLIENKEVSEVLKILKRNQNYNFSKYNIRRTEEHKLSGVKIKCRETN